MGCMSRSSFVDDPAVAVDHAGLPRVDDGVWDDELSLEDLAAMGMSTTPPRLIEPAPHSAEAIRGAVESGVSGAGLVERLAAAGPVGDRSEAELVDHVDWWGRVIGYCQVMQAREVAELLARREAEPVEEDRPFAKDPLRDVCAQVGLALRCSTRAAEHVVADSQLLIQWPATAAALKSGRIDLATARAISEEAGLAGAAYRAVIEAAALAQAAEGATARSVRMFTRRLAIRFDPAAAAERATAARGERGVSKTGVVDDMGELRAVLTAAELKDVWETLTARAKALDAVDDDGNEKCLDDKRADVLVDLILHPERVRDCAHDPDASRWMTDLVVAASTLAGEDEDPGELVGHGLITAPAARRLAAAATWRRLIIDSTTGSNTSPAGRSRSTPTAPSPGPRPRDTATEHPHPPSANEGAGFSSTVLGCLPSR